MMNDQVNRETCDYAVRMTKLTTNNLWKCLKLMAQHIRNKKAAAQKDKVVHGKQTVKELIGQGQGVTTVDIGKSDLKDFQRLAKKYGVDFAVVKDKNSEPPVYTVFFKAKDEDAITNVVRAYTEKKMKQQEKERPSVLDKLRQFKDKVMSIPRQVHEKRKERER